MGHRTSEWIVAVSASVQAGMMLWLCVTMWRANRGIEHLLDGRIPPEGS